MEKVKVTYTIDKDTKDKFADICNKKAINMSAWIELKIKEFIDQEGDK